MINENEKIFTCSNCKSEDKHIGVVRRETHYYSVLLETNQ